MLVTAGVSMEIIFGAIQRRPLARTKEDGSGRRRHKHLRVPHWCLRLLLRELLSREHLELQLRYTHYQLQEPSRVCQHVGCHGRNCRCLEAVCDSGLPGTQVQNFYFHSDFTICRNQSCRAITVVARDLRML
ncbi:hypothetical protein CKAH01_13657 [Colletotrichum kahawae]|uniref:Uncharacterized protein n=1 Tax=Colletotrichum kahawae TaxID=34407 RepID=A0AAD9YNT8_COLKA|nr:hypothetical protein CKAH01_13657 [Colletotrichum kahawae]